MKRVCLIVFATVLILSAILSMTAFSRGGNQEKSPRMRCLESCQASHNSCLAGAKDSKGNSDPAKVSACTKALNECLKGCPQNP
jgi:hypothetical protein